MPVPNSLGYFEKIDNGCVRGWACDANGRPAPVSVHVNGVLAAAITPKRSWSWFSGSAKAGNFKIRLRLAPGDRVEVFHGNASRALPGGVRTVVDPGWRPRVGIAAPIKQEAPYLLEWIAYHRALGVGTFVLGDNGGTDFTSELLQALDAIGVIQRLDWRGEVALQLRFVMEAVARLRGVVDICSFNDVDEFLRPLGGRPDIPTAAAEIFARPQVSAAGVCWVIYGSSGRLKPGEGLVMERFKLRAADAYKHHRTVKTIARPECVTGWVNPHAATTSGGEYVNDRGETMIWGNNAGGGEFISWNSLRVDHFVIKSRQEFEMKALRGSATGAQDRDEAFFTSRDLNEVLDPMPAEFVERTKHEMARLRDRLKAVVATDSPLRNFLC